MHRLQRRSFLRLLSTTPPCVQLYLSFYLPLHRFSFRTCYIPDLFWSKLWHRRPPTHGLSTCLTYPKQEVRQYQKLFGN